MAGSAEEWTSIFKKENSGTYNDQYMILDLNKINLKEKKIPEKSLMIIEQLPGETDINDVTEILKKGYWPSYNVPYSDKIYTKSGYKIILDSNKDLYKDCDYNNCSRANIFKREQKNVKNIDDYKKLMRYNDFENDEYSYNDPSLTIACRSDLGEKKECYGTTDVKFVSVKELLEEKINIHIISGPTNVQQPTFSWKNTTCYEESPNMWYHEGVVDTWNFPWVDYKVQLLNNKNNQNDDSSKKDYTQLIIIISCVAGSMILIIIIIIIIVIAKKKSTYEKLRNEVNNISYKDENKTNEREEDLLS